MPAVQKKIPIKEIRDGIVVLENNTLHCVLKCSSINFFLRSREERNGLIFKYQQFLNSLDFPVQILIVSRRVNLDNYLEKLEEAKRKQENELLRIQTSQYIEYIRKLTEITNLVNKNFYVVVSYMPVIVSKQGIWSTFKNLFGLNNNLSLKDDREFERKFSQWKYQLQERVEYIVGGLLSLGIQVSLLNDPDLINLFYHLYNLGNKEDIIKE